MWGRDVAGSYADDMEFVGLCDINPGRVAFARQHIGVDCPTFTDFREMMTATSPDSLIVTTVDATHDEFIVAGMEMGADIVTEKPMTTDEIKCQAILDAQERTGKNIVVTHNYRYSPHRQRMKELLMEGRIGRVTSVDFHWYLDIWWLDSEPDEVFASGALEYYGRNNAFRHSMCRGCPHRDDCRHYWDITQDELLSNLYVANEHHDGYIRDGCVWAEDIDIYDKMAAQIKYANDVQVNYSCTTYSPYEGYRIAFNGTAGRLEAWIQERQPWQGQDYDEIRVTDNFGETHLERIPHGGGGHGGGDVRLRDRIFRNPDAPDPYRQAAGSRDGAMAVLLGIAARTSVKTGQPVKIGSMTSLKPQATRP
jgi:predicted dehydrogenase